MVMLQVISSHHDLISVTLSVSSPIIVIIITLWTVEYIRYQSKIILNKFGGQMNGWLIINLSTLALG